MMKRRWALGALAPLLTVWLGMVPAGAASPPAATGKSATATTPRPAATASRGFVLAPPPAWVQPTSVGTVPAELPASAVQLLLVERQTRLAPAGSQRFVRVVRQINDASGLQQAAQIEVEFDPTYQQLALHHIDVWRGGTRIRKLDAAKVKLLHREPQLERQMIDGRMTASLVLDDVRVGDRIDLAYSLDGDNPVFDGKFVDADWTQASLGPVALYQYRLLSPTARPVRHRSGDPSVVVSSRVQGDWRETLFQRRLAPQFRYDPTAPGGAYLKDQLQLSEFADWAEVARWADGLFAMASRPGPDVMARAAELAAQTSDPAERLRLALDLVQNEIRYFGTEIGANSHRPAPADAVLRQRFGDCKDKVSLLKAVLQALGLPSTPVLVSTHYLRDVNGMLPSPLAFDHVVIRTALGERPLVLDPTRTLQTGPATARQALGLGEGLLASAESNALLKLPGSESTLWADVVDTLSFGKLSEDAVLESRQTYHGDFAERVRQARASLPAADFDAQMATEHLRMYPRLQPEGGAVVTDVPQANAVTVVLRFRMTEPWRFPEQRQLLTDVGFPVLMSVLRLPDQSPRTRPLRLSLPGIYRQSVVMRFAEDVYRKPATERVDEVATHFRLSLAIAGQANTQRVDGELRVLNDTVAVADFQRHRDALIKAWPRLSSSVGVSALNFAQVDRLRPRLAALNDDVQRGRIQVHSAIQREALGNVLILGEQIAGDRLAPKLLAEALVARGEANDHLGRLSDGQADFQRATVLDPANAAARSAQAVNALMRGAYADAVSAADSALALNPASQQTRYTRAYARYFLRDFAAVRQELTDLLASPAEVDRGYGQVWLYLATRQAGGDAEAAVRPHVPNAIPPAWPYAIVRYLTGQAELSEALAAASVNGVPQPGRLCELYFFAGQRALLDGNEPLARQFLQKSVDTRITEFVEYGLAQRELERLNRR